MGMLSFLVRRTITFVPTIVGVMLITYIIAYVIPTDPVRAWVGGEKLLNPEALELVRRKYKFDAPWYEQFTFLFSQLLSGTLEDPVRHRSIVYELTTRFPITAQLAIFGMFFTVLIGIPLGVIAALRKDSPADFFVRFFALFGSSMPSFVLYYLLILVFFVALKATYLAGVPTYSLESARFLSELPQRIPVIGHLLYYIGSVPIFGALMCGEWDTVHEIIKRFYVPGLALGMLGGGFLARIVRNSMLDALSSEYVLFAKARGLPKLRVWGHALKNTMVPVVTVLGVQFGGLLCGAIIAETVFNIPGMGRYIYDSITRLNFPAIISGTFIFAIVYVVINLLVDIVYALIDPRIRY